MSSSKRVLVVLVSGVLALLAWCALFSPQAAERAGKLTEDLQAGLGVPGRELGELLPLAYQDSTDLTGIAERRWSPRGKSLTHALWVEGRVMTAMGTPPDETLAVRAHRRDAEQGYAFEQSVSYEGSFSVAFPEGTTQGAILLRGRYQYLAEELRLDPRTQKGPLRIEPLLGGRAVGRLLLPADSRATPESIAGLRVLLYALNSEGARTVHRSVEPVGSDFQLDALPPGSYLVGIASETVYTHAPVPLTIESGKSGEVELALYAGATLAGRVCGEDGQPIPGVEVRANTGLPGKGVDFQMRTMRTDVDGSFRLRGLPPGERVVRVDPPGYLPLERSFALPGEGQELPDVTLVLRRGESLSGSVAYPDGRPAEATVIVTRVGSGDPFHALVTCKPDGTFHVTGLGPGEYRVEARAVLVVERREVSRTTGKEHVAKQRRNLRAFAEDVAAGTQGLSLRLDPGFTLAGSVRDDAGRPLEGFTVEAARGGVEELLSGLEFTARMRESFDEARGVFELSGLSAGPWTIRVTAPGHAPAEPRALELPRDLAPLEVVLQRLARLEGGVLGPGGGPAAEAVVRLTVEGPCDGPRVRDAPAARGAFVFEAIPSGTVRLGARAGRAERSAEVALALAPGETRGGLVLELLPCGAIEVQVLDAGGRPESGREVRARAPSLGIVETARTDADGKARLEALPNGSYEVEVIEDPRPEAAGSGDPGGLLGRRARVLLDAGETESVVLIPGDADPGRLHGRALLQGEPLAAAWVSLSDFDTHASHTSTDADA